MMLNLMSGNLRKQDDGAKLVFDTPAYPCHSAGDLE
jgi:hypothetical protein